MTKYDTMFSLNNNPTLKSRLGEQHDYAIWELAAFDGGWDDWEESNANFKRLPGETLAAFTFIGGRVN